MNHLGPSPRTRPGMDFDIFLKFGVSIMLIHFPSEICREFIWIRSRKVQDHISHFHVKLASVEIGPSFRQIWSPRANTAKTLFDNSVCTPLDAHSTCLDCTCLFPRLADKSLNLPNPRKSLNNMKIKPVNRDIKKDVLRRVLQDLISQTSWNDFKSTKDYWHLVCEWEWSASFDQCKTCEIMNQLGAKTSASSWKKTTSLLPSTPNSSSFPDLGVARRHFKLHCFETSAILRAILTFVEWSSSHQHHWVSMRIFDISDHLCPMINIYHPIPSDIHMSTKTTDRVDRMHGMERMPVSTPEFS